MTWTSVQVSDIYNLKSVRVQTPLSSHPHNLWRKTITTRNHVTRRGGRRAWLTILEVESGKMMLTLKVLDLRKLGSRTLRDPREWSDLLATVPARRDRRRERRRPMPSASLSPRWTPPPCRRSFMEADRWRLRAPLFPGLASSVPPPAMAVAVEENKSRVDPESLLRNPVPKRASRDMLSGWESLADSENLRRKPRILRVSSGGLDCWYPSSGHTSSLSSWTSIVDAAASISVVDSLLLHSLRIFISAFTKLARIHVVSYDFHFHTVNKQGMRTVSHYQEIIQSQNTNTNLKYFFLIVLFKSHQKDFIAIRPTPGITRRNTCITFPHCVTDHKITESPDIKPKY